MMTPIDERQPLLLPVVGIVREDADGDDLNATGKHHQTPGGDDRNTTTQSASKPAHAIKKVLLITLCICVLGFLACVSLASLNKTNSSGKTSNGLGKRINEKNLSWSADEKMDAVERVTNPGGRRSKKKDSSQIASGFSSVATSSSSSSVSSSSSKDLISKKSNSRGGGGGGNKVRWELSEYASKDGKQESERKQKQANLVEVLKENQIVNEDKEYEKPKRREQRIPTARSGSSGSSTSTTLSPPQKGEKKSNNNNNVDYLGMSSNEYAWEPPSDLPESFDAREKWPECSEFIGEAWDQGECGSCWAIAPTKVMSDRLCIASGGKVQERLAASEILSCGQLVSEFSFGSCEGGMPDDAYEFAKEFGVASGGKYGDEKGCAAYPFPPCHHPCHVQPTPACPLKSDTAQCQGDLDEHTRNEVAQHIDKLIHCPDGDYDCMAREIYNSGPVSSYAGTIYDEFYAYKDGAYRTSADSETRGRSHGGHVIEVIGWHKESDGTYSWKIINSWLNWGKKGHGRIAVGELSIGDSVESATMLADTNVAR